MPVALDQHLLVATCIGCGARSRPGMCAEGCDDVPLDLVESAHIDAERQRLADLSTRVDALHAVVATLAEDALEWDVMREQARQALLIPTPAQAEPIAIVEAWGCARCGRVDAPQPCIGVCIRHPVEMADAREYTEFAEQAAACAVVDRDLTCLVRLVAHVAPRSGQAEATRAALRERACAALADAGLP